MSDPGPSSLTPVEERADYAPSDSPSEDEYGSSRSDFDTTPAFKGLPQLPAIEEEISEATSATDLRPSGIIKHGGSVYQVIPEWTMISGPHGSYRRPAILPGDGNPSTYAQYVRFLVNRAALYIDPQTHDPKY